ncbi:MAG: AAA-like domain-containing protein [Xenococcaceae cyanobacterium]
MEEILAGHYQVVEHLSEGGFGQTFLAIDNHLPGKPLCVVKQLKPRVRDLATLETAKRLFDCEAETLYKLGDHDQIPRLLAHFEQDEEFYLAQEFIEGEPLDKEITPGKQLSEAYVIELLQDILQVLAFVHEQNVIHRDIKPANLIRRSEDGKIVLIDFGAVKEVRTQVTNIHGQTSLTVAVGTPGYMPSEQKGFKPRFSSDVYAVGMVCLQALSGLSPEQLPQDSQCEYCCATFRDRAPVSPGLAAILDKMVRYDYRQRYGTATEALQALEQLLNQDTKGVELISGFLGWILLTFFIGFICNRSDADLKEACQAGIEVFINSLKPTNQSVNQELQKAVTRSFFKAQQRIATEYRHELGGLFPTFGQFSPFHSQQQRNALRWVNQKIPQLNQEIKNQQSVEMRVELLDEINSLLRSSDEIHNKRNKLLVAVLKGDEPPGYVEKLQRDKDGLFNLVCACFAEEIKTHPQLRDIFSSLLLAPINAQLTGSVLTIEDLTHSLLNATLDLEKLKPKPEPELPTVLQDSKTQPPPLSPLPDIPKIADRDRSPAQSALEEPSGQVSLNSNFYVERPPIESDCYEAILKPAALIRVKAPRQMGKTSLMSRILHHAKQSGLKTAFLNFQSADTEFLTNLDMFLQWFCASITDELELEEKLDKYWSGPLGIKNKCTKYFQRYLLSEITSPLALGLDEVDQIFQHPEIATDFFGLLRAWHERGKNEEIWKKLRLVIVHSKEVYIPMNINQSPFNVGLPIELPELNLVQVQSLVQRHELDWSEEQIEQLMAMVGGHPYLVRKALYQIARGRMTLAELLQVAPTEEGPYGDHLRRHLLNLEDNAELHSAIKQVVTVDSPVEIGTEEAFKLRSMGLVKFQGNAVIPLCDMYRQYFGDRLAS